MYVQCMCTIMFALVCMLGRPGKSKIESGWFFKNECKPTYILMIWQSFDSTQIYVTEYFQIEEGLHQWLALSHILFIRILGVVTSHIDKNVSWATVFAHDRVPCITNRVEVE